MWISIHLSASARCHLSQTHLHGELVSDPLQLAFSNLLLLRLKLLISEEELPLKICLMTHVRFTNTSRLIFGAPQEGFGFEASNLPLGKPAFFQLHRCHASAAKDENVYEYKSNCNLFVYTILIQDYCSTWTSLIFFDFSITRVALASS